MNNLFATLLLFKYKVEKKYPYKKVFDELSNVIVTREIIYDQSADIKNEFGVNWVVEQYFTFCKVY